MPTPQPLTSRQQQVLQVIQTAIGQTGVPPTRAEIAQALGFKSVNAAEDHLHTLARKGHIQLVTGVSRGIRLVPPKHPPTMHQMALPDPQLQQLMLPLIGRVAAGSPVLAQEHTDRHYQLDANLFGSQPPDYLLRVKGLSMRDIGMLEGDLIAVQRTAQARNGQIVVARIDDEVTVKRFWKGVNGIELRAENPDFATLHVGAHQQFAIEGLVVGLIRQQGLM
jgi:repressor LexA